MLKSLILFFFFLITHLSVAQDRQAHVEIEGGIITTKNMEIHGYNQANATEGWKKTAPVFRLEYWTTKENNWNYGFVLQPLKLNYSSVLTSDLNNKGKVFSKGEDATLNYQFPTFRFSANRPIFQSSHSLSYIRGGGSLIARYAKVELASKSNSFSETNFIVIPVFNLETSVEISNGYSFFTRSDFLPGIDGNIFLDGLFDVFLGIRHKFQQSKTMDIGLRSFFGGYDPKKADDYANKIFFNSFVVRFSF
jgi:hypothetical protein